ncbi:MAG: MFS transporter [Proteobacteria bacterium]|nr:MFS transporter [Pseudomonadota bacterium]
MIRFLLGHDNTTVNVNQPLTLISAIYIAVVGPEVFIVQPGFVQGLVAHYRFSEQEAGYVASAEMWGIALTTVLMSFMAGRVNWRHALLFSIVVVALGNLASLGAEGAASFGWWRFITGLGSGALVSLSFTMIGLTANPDRNFGYLIMGVLTYGALGLWLMPSAFGIFGMQGVIIFFALFALSSLPLLRYLPSSGEEHVQIEEDAVDLPRGLRAMALATMFIYFLGQGVVWAYLFLIGTNSGISEQEVANGLTVSQFAGVAGAMAAAMVGKRFGRISPISLGILAGIIPLAFLFGKFGSLAYATVVCVYNFAWNMTHPYLLAAMASFDRGGRLVAHAVGGQMLGLAIGPALAALAIGDHDYSKVLLLGMIFFAMSWGLIMRPLLSQRRRIMTQIRPV